MFRRVLVMPYDASYNISCRVLSFQDEAFRILMLVVWSHLQCHFCRSHTRTLLSKEPDTSSLSSNCTQFVESVWPSRTCTEGVPCLWWIHILFSIVCVTLQNMRCSGQYKNSYNCIDSPCGPSRYKPKVCCACGGI
jgi:hypothetical protein